MAFYTQMLKKRFKGWLSRHPLRQSHDGLRKEFLQSKLSKEFQIQAILMALFTKFAKYPQGKDMLG